MPYGPQDRSTDDSIQQVGPEHGQDPTTPEVVAEPGRKRNNTDAEWLSMAAADPAYFLKDPSSE